MVKEMELRTPIRPISRRISFTHVTSTRGGRKKLCITATAEPGNAAVGKWRHFESRRLKTLYLLNRGNSVTRMFVHP